MVYKKFSRSSRRYARKAVKGFKTFTRKRYGTWTNPHLRNIVSDVRLLKSLINVEKKHISYTFNSGFAQYNTLPTLGHLITPLLSLSQGSTVATRTGNSVKGTSIQFNFRIVSNASQTASIQYSIIIVKKIGSIYNDAFTTGTGGTMLENFLTLDYNNTYSTRSLRNVERFRDWIVYKRINGMFKADESSTSGTPERSHDFYIKMRDHLKFDNATAEPIENQFYCILVASNGDVNANTGLHAYCQYRFHYIDN